MQLFASRAADSDGDFVLDDVSDAGGRHHLHQRRSPAAGHRADRGAHAGVLGATARRARSIIGSVWSAPAASGRPPATADDARRRRLELRPAVRRRAAAADAGCRVFAGGFTLDAATQCVRRRHLARRRHRRRCWPDWSTSRWWSPDEDPGRTPDSACSDPSPSTPQARLDEAGETRRDPHAAHAVADRSDRRTDGRSARARCGSSGRTWPTPSSPTSLRAADWGLGDGDPADALQIGVNLGWYAFLSANVQNDEPVMLELLERAGRRTGGTCDAAR